MATLKEVCKCIWLLLAFLVFDVQSSDSTADTLPHLCYNVKCPPMSEITCPEDSSVREILNTIDLQHFTTAPEIADTDALYNITEIDEEIYAECCLAKKCLCKTCYIPDCHGEDEVVVELQPESMNKPGHCCGEYECQRTPNCKAEGDSQLYWLKGCQRCHCFSGKPMCIQICDEAVNKTKAICKPEKLNVFFEHGESWRVGCYECECVDGVEKCVLPFCSNINCPRERQIILKDGCCPICWPDCAPIPNELLRMNKYANDKYGSTGARHYDDDDDDDDEDLTVEEQGQQEGSLSNNAQHVVDYSAENEIDTLPDIPFEEDDELVAEKQLSSANATAEVQANNTTATTAIITSSSSTTVSSSSTTTTTAATTAGPVNFSTSTIFTQAEQLSHAPTTVAPTPTHGALTSERSIATVCPPAAVIASRHDAPENFQLYPDDVVPEIQVITESCKHWMIYIIIGVLVALIAVLIAWIIQLRLKQRSYRPVSHIDDNFNKMSCNIKATNAYV
ncbi:uncharacterized protein [Eurosta solidaginis]|uniref:uncharacterized protein n=1 Tax=Eurosta solidaginis TaxID=178769 RepID=UPI0035310FAA